MDSKIVQAHALRSSAWLSLVLALLARCHPYHSVFICRTKSGSMILTLYVDILLTGSDSVALAEAKEYLKCHFMTKDMGKLKYFLEIEVAYKKT